MTPQVVPESSDDPFLAPPRPHERPQNATSPLGRRARTSARYWARTSDLRLVEQSGARSAMAPYGGAKPNVEPSARALYRSVSPRLRAMLGIFPAIPKIDSGATLPVLRPRARGS